MSSGLIRILALCALVVLLSPVSAARDKTMKLANDDGTGYKASCSLSAHPLTIFAGNSASTSLHD